MKWLFGVLAAIVLVAAAVFALVLSGAIGANRPVGFQLVRAADPEGAPLTVAIWYPTNAQPLPTTMLGLTLLDVAPNAAVAGQSLPLIVISHGNGGGPGSHADTAMALAASGFIVAAPMHTGDNFRDESDVGSGHWLTDRARHIRATLDYMLTRWPDHTHIAPRRIGVFGFSAGALTALVTIGAQPDLSRVASHCTTSPEFACTLLQQAHSELLQGRDVPPLTAFAADPRIGAAVVAAPGLGFTLTPAGLSRVNAPVQLWAGDADTNVPYATNTGPVREGLGTLAEFHAAPNARHFSFLAPCGLLGPPLLCSEPQGFDRRAFHRSFNTQVVAFFEAKLPAS